MITITSLCDNVNNSKRLWSTEGNSLLVDAFDKRILFDVGRSCEILDHNLDALSVCKDTITDIVLTHGHKGHVGAASAGFFLKNATIHYGSDFEVPKFKYKAGEYKPVGNENIVLSLKNLALNCVDGVFEVLKDKIYIFKSERSYPALAEEKMRVLFDGEYRQDFFLEELNLCLKTSRGLVVISGCAHGGVKNILETATEKFSDRVYAFVGGTHILNDKGRTEEFISLMKDMDVKLVAPTHCTGIFSRAYIGKELAERFTDLSVGQRLNIEE